MKKLRKSFFILSGFCLLGSIPIGLVVVKHLHTVKRWETLNDKILTLKVARDLNKTILKQNNLLINNRENFCEEKFSEESQKIPLLKQEILRLNSLSKNSLIAQSKEVWARKQTLTKTSQLQWIFKKIDSDLISISFLKPIEMNNDDISAVFHLFNPIKNPKAPIAFFTHWEMTKQITPLKNEVWLVQAEAINRCL
ncbi:hypothetical protein [Chlamydia sp. 17-3921]|uniref:hypothetical protein n=1 Tax=Chlamydia sp. 17-3921 TaxID=2675798 RepID=UPI0019191D21|nr:hypothetical protein [Chlamydia sp. 17-3921]